MPAAGRVGDKAQAQGPGCAHGCPACPHPAIGPGIIGSPDVFINSRFALRVDDIGMHAVCCGMNMWTAKMGAPTVFINGKQAFRQNDMGQTCGGMTKLIEGSPNVLVGDGAGGGNAPSAGAKAGKIDIGSKGSGGTGTQGGGAGGGSPRGSGGGETGAGGDGAGSTSAAAEERLIAAAARRENALPPKEEEETEAWVEIVLTDEEGEPLAGRDYKLELPDFTVVEGKLDDKGRVRREHLIPGLARLWLPDEDPDVPPVPPPRPTEDEPKHWLDVQLLDENGVPAAGTMVKIELPDGSVVEEKTDEAGWLRKEGLDPGEAKLHVLDEKAMPPPAAPPPRPPHAEEEPEAWFEMELTDDEGRPAAGMKVKLELPDGTVLEEKLDDAGRLRKAGLKAGDVKLHLPEDE